MGKLRKPQVRSLRDRQLLLKDAPPMAVHYQRLANISSEKQMLAYKDRQG
jgi:hypothetical protein